MKLLLKSPFDSLSGFGNDGIGMAQALADSGHDVHLFPVAVTPPITEQVASLLTKWPTPPFDAVIVHLSPGALEAKTLRGSTSRLIAWSMFENEEFRPPGWERVRPQLADTGFDLILAYDEVTEKALVDPAINPGIPVRQLQGGYTPDFWMEADPIARYRKPGPFKFGMVGRLDRRKNPWAAVEAFQRLRNRYGDSFDAELHLKTTLPGLPPSIGDRIFTHYEWWPHLKLREFYESIHCLLCPSTGEGKNVPALEAMSTGAPVIATRYGGHMGWLSEQWAYGLDWDPWDWPEGKSTRPRVDHLEELMLRVYENRAEARAKGELARRTVPNMMSWRSVVSRLVDVLNSWPLSEVRNGDGRRDAVPGEPEGSARQVAPIG